MTVLDVRGLRVRFETPSGDVVAVDELTLGIEEGQTVALVGESGSGKTVTALALMGLVPTPPGIVETGKVLLGGRNLMTLSPNELRRVRGKEIAMVFQHPQTALNPLLTIGEQLVEVLELHTNVRGRDLARRCAKALGDVGIAEPELRLRAYPHELSGGMCQRVMIAMALLGEPSVLIADEPTTALDVTVQSQILELLKDVQEKHGTAILLITHDLAIVAGMAHRIYVMYAGRVVESADCEELFAQPVHPYTFGLLSSVPSLAGPVPHRMTSITGQPPDPGHLPPGCSFNPRCPFMNAHCTEDQPLLEPLRETTTGYDVARTLTVGAHRRAACFEKERVASLTALWTPNVQWGASEATEDAGDAPDDAAEELFEPDAPTGDESSDAAGEPAPEEETP